MANRKRDKVLQIRVTAEERDSVRTATNQCGACSIVEWMLAAVRVTDTHPQLIAKAAAEIRAEESNDAK